MLAILTSSMAGLCAKIELLFPGSCLVSGMASMNILNHLFAIIVILAFYMGYDLHFFFYSSRCLEVVSYLC